ncbi:carboxymuconolactone decarboxylase family protein [Thioalkalivibrio denitrificans]|nr:carboxymuconolactone decarboxylase family protein [Thioalkalivibrio denitrificans]
MSTKQKEQADALINGPRKGIKGPFIPLMRSPELLENLASTGEYLRFKSTLPEDLKEFATLIVARETSNQFEWAVHYPLAIAAGVAPESLKELFEGARPQTLSPDEAVVYDFTRELSGHHGLSDGTYARAVAVLKEQGVVEMTALIGYFYAVCWIMNVARTPSQLVAETGPLHAFPI